MRSPVTSEPAVLTHLEALLVKVSGPGPSRVGARTRPKFDRRISGTSARAARPMIAATLDQDREVSLTSPLTALQILRPLVPRAGLNPVGRDPPVLLEPLGEQHLQRRLRTRDYPAAGRLVVGDSQADASTRLESRFWYSQARQAVQDSDIRESSVTESSSPVATERNCPIESKPRSVRRLRVRTPAGVRHGPGPSPGLGRQVPST